MSSCFAICPDRPAHGVSRCALIALCALVLVHASEAIAGENAGRRDLENTVGSAVGFLRTQQRDDGSFGAAQPRLQTSLAMLALMSTRSELSDEDTLRVENAARFLLQAGSRTGNIGDDVFRTESHALATTALLCALPRLRDPALRAKSSEAAYRALRMLQRWQDRSSSSASRGGWKMDGAKGRQNDRRATAWALVCYRAAELYGVGPKDAQIARGLSFLVGSLNSDAKAADQLGGLSVDEQGLAVASVSAMGGLGLQLWRSASPEAKSNHSWLAGRPSKWSGPNYFYTEFFRVRALKRADANGPAFERAARSALMQIRDHQSPNGSVAYPPGNAQNTIAMGPVFSTSMAVLILNARSSRLVFDEDFRVEPLIARPRAGRTTRGSAWHAPSSAPNRTRSGKSCGVKRAGTADRVLGVVWCGGVVGTVVSPAAALR